MMVGASVEERMPLQGIPSMQSFAATERANGQKIKHVVLGILVGMLFMFVVMMPRTGDTETIPSLVDVNARSRKSKAKAMTSMGRFPEPYGHTKDCMSPRFTKETLKTVKEQSLLYFYFTYEGDENTPSANTLLEKYEASDVVGSPDQGSLYVVFDNSYDIGRLSRGQTTSGSLGKKENALLKWPNKTFAQESQFEAIAYNKTSDTYLVLEETHVRSQDQKVMSLVHEVTFLNDRVNVVRECIVEYEFTSDNKGLEGADMLYTDDGESYLLGLCEGNYCEGGARGREVGNGRLLVFQLQEIGNRCSYKLIQTLSLSPEVAFMDYSALSIFDGRRAAITSQENAAAYVVDFKATHKHNSNGTRTLDIRAENGKIYDFPRNDLCEIKYCNVEGAHLFTENLLVTVSDAMKSKGRQPFVCREKAQSVELFAIPP